MFCGKCGNQIPDNATSCPNCGDATSLSGGFAPGAVSPVPENPMQASPQFGEQPQYQAEQQPAQQPAPQAESQPQYGTTAQYNVSPQPGAAPQEAAPQPGAGFEQAAPQPGAVPQSGATPQYGAAPQFGTVPQYGATPQYAPTAQPAKKSKKPLIIVVVVLVVLLLIAGAIGAVLAFAGNNDPFIASGTAAAKTFEAESGTMELSVVALGEVVEGQMSWKWGEDLKSSTFFAEADYFDENIGILFNNDALYIFENGESERLSGSAVEVGQDMLENEGVRNVDINNFVKNGHLNSSYIGESAKEFEEFLEDNMSAYTDDSGESEAMQAILTDFHLKAMTDKNISSRIIPSFEVESGFLGFGDKTFTFELDVQAYLEELGDYADQRGRDDASLSDAASTLADTCSEAAASFRYLGSDMRVWNITIKIEDGFLKSLKAETSGSSSSSYGSTQFSVELRYKDYDQSVIDRALAAS